LGNFDGFLLVFVKLGSHPWAAFCIMAKAEDVGAFSLEHAFGNQLLNIIIRNVRGGYLDNWYRPVLPIAVCLALLFW
jgi:hypothetical protein